MSGIVVSVTKAMDATDETKSPSVKLKATEREMQMLNNVFCLRDTFLLGYMLSGSNIIQQRVFICVYLKHNWRKRFTQAQESHILCHTGVSAVLH